MLSILTMNFEIFKILDNSINEIAQSFFVWKYLSTKDDQNSYAQHDCFWFPVIVGLQLSYLLALADIFNW